MVLVTSAIFVACLHHKVTFDFFIPICFYVPAPSTFWALSFTASIYARDPPGGSLETLHRMLKETFPLGDFPVALYVSAMQSHRTC